MSGYLDWTNPPTDNYKMSPNQFFKVFQSVESDDKIDELEGFYSWRAESAKIIFWACCCLLEGTAYSSHSSDSTRTEAYWNMRC